MKFIRLFLGVILVTIGCSNSQQKGYTLTEVRTIDLPNVDGRIDHISMDLKLNRLFVAAHGNNTVEVLDLNTGRVIKSITGLDEPQGVLFCSKKNFLFVTSGGDGTCKIFDADNFNLIETIQLGGDADNIRLDEVRNIVFAGFGSGGIAAINLLDLKVLYKIDLPGHPESFQIDEKRNKIFVNVPGAGQLDAIDLNNKKVTNKINLQVKSNFAMALDTVHQVIFIGSRNPSKLLSFDANNLELLSENDLSGDADDIYYSGKDSLIFISCGSGSIDVFKEINPKGINLKERIETSPGARTSLFVPELKKYFVALRKSGNHNARIKEYDIKSE
jgi:YVTN family beta-propeller protein